ncbi:MULTISPECIES: cell wall-binding repeat-containing protein [unclassified Leucobacter]|uniref:cell wall-binding repeat-containing protein n=1 Tax=unclassified Leucobacter TaxID=2621730 RepID=UPI0006213429|nr:cell wall-binding repeat-containing protein [Leucobacter sp. Ag1]KKI22127.1 hypothetical protein XM48_03020 [Leucobacter sp. Ag1]
MLNFLTRSGAAPAHRAGRPLVIALVAALAVSLSLVPAGAAPASAEESASLIGQISVPAGVDPENVEVMLRDAGTVEPANYPVTVDREGRFRVDGITAGTYRITASEYGGTHPSGRQLFRSTQFLETGNADMSLSFSAGQEQTRSFTMLPATARISGGFSADTEWDVMYATAYQRINGAWVSFDPAFYEDVQPGTSHYETPLLVPGTYTMQFTAFADVLNTPSNQVWWKDQPGRVTATPIMLSADQEQPDVNGSVDLYRFETVPVPTISGTVRAGSTLTADPGQWSPKPAFAYEWARNGVAIPGATKASYVVTSADVGARITVGVFGRKALYSTEYRVSAPAGTGAPTAERIAGGDRYETAVQVSRVSFVPGVKVAYIANGLSFPDALSGAAAAGAQDGPVLLVAPNSVPASVRSELDRLHPERIVVLGGSGVVSQSVERTLRNYTLGAVERSAGSDRFATSASVSAGSFSPGVGVAYIADGMNFPDALAGAAAAGAQGGPVLLARSNSIPDAVATELRRLKPARIVILGGTGAVGDSVQNALRSYTRGAVTRDQGADRFATAAAVSRSTFAAGAPVAYVANGFGFADALSGAAAAGTQGGPVLLVGPAGIPAATQAELSRLKPKRIVVLGGEGVVSAGVKTQLGRYVTP